MALVVVGVRWVPVSRDCGWSEGPRMSMKIGSMLAAVSFDCGSGLNIQPWSAGCSTRSQRSGRTGRGGTGSGGYFHGNDGGRVVMASGMREFVAGSCRAVCSIAWGDWVGRRAASSPSQSAQDEGTIERVGGYWGRNEQVQRCLAVAKPRTVKRASITGK